MAVDKERVLDGFRKSRELIKSTGGKEITITEDKKVKFGKNEYELYKGWVMPDLSDEDLAKILCVETMVTKMLLSKEIAYDDIIRISSEVFDD